MISVARRREAVLRLLNSDFDIDSTVKWVLRELADEPVMMRAKNKEALARNIITIGSTGIQQELNLVAFQQALAEYGATRRKSAMDSLTQENKALEDKVAALESDVREQRREIQTQARSLDKVHTAKDEVEKARDELRQQLMAADRETMALRLEAANTRAENAEEPAAV